MTVTIPIFMLVLMSIFSLIMFAYSFLQEDEPIIPFLTGLLLAAYPLKYLIFEII